MNIQCIHWISNQSDKSTGIGEKGWIKLCQAIHLAQSCNIKVLSIPNNNIGEKGCKELVHLLYDNKLKNLSVLNLEGNKIGSIGFAGLMRALQISNNQTILEVLNVANNNIGLKGIKMARETLKQCQFLKLHTLQIGCIVFKLIVY